MNRAGLGLWDTVSIIVGIVIGAGIFETAPMIFQTVNHSGLALGVWIAGGILSLVGALCYAELASSYPSEGGDYAYLSRSYGSSIGFLFGWTQLAVILTGSIGMMAYIFADYLAVLFGLDAGAEYLYATLSVAVLAVLNIFGLNTSKRTQNVLSGAKMLGLALIIVAGIAGVYRGYADGSLYKLASESQSGNIAGFWNSVSLALIFVLYTYGGWNDAAFVASEVRNKKRNIVRALVLGTLVVTVVYLLVNISYLVGLGLEGAKNSKAIAADLLVWPFGSLGSVIVSILVIISALSAVNGLIFTGSRIFSAMGNDHPLFARLGKWNHRTQSPIWSISALSTVSIFLIVLVGSSAGQSALSMLMVSSGFEIPRWDGRGGFDTLLMCTAPVFWFFFLLTGLSVFVLRWREPERERTFQVPLYPLTPGLFCLTCVFMLYQSVSYAGTLTLIGVLPVTFGVPLYWLSRHGWNTKEFTNQQPSTRSANSYT